MDVTVLRWPEERQRREHLARAACPRLLLVADGEVPPHSTDCLEDWVRVPAADTEVRHRVRTLSDRASAHQPDRPTLDADGVLRLGLDWTSLPPVEARIAVLLLDRLGAVVSREALARAGWPDGSPGRNALDVHVLRLRRRLEPLALAIRTVRSRGYLLEVTSESHQIRVREA